LESTIIKFGDDKGKLKEELRMKEIAQKTQIEELQNQVYQRIKDSESAI
jgi:hypothetical protein